MRFIAILLLFAAATTAQTGSISMPGISGNLPAQPIGPNDLIAVSVYGAPEFSLTVRVDADGLFRMPMLQQRVKADGLYPADVERAIAQALREEQLLVDPFVTVSIAAYYSRPIVVSGAVKAPLVFQAEGPTTLLEAIARAQGLSASAGQEILVTLPQASADSAPVVITQRIPVRSLIDNADPALNLTLTGGEEIRVPEMSRIYLVGNVKKPGAFPVQDGAETTVLQMVALAEGLAPFPGKEAFIYRRNAAGVKNEIPIPLEKIMKRQAPDVPLAANDILYIPDRSGKRIAVAALERILGLGSAGAAALIYTTR